MKSTVNKEVNTESTPNDTKKENKVISFIKKNKIIIAAVAIIAITILAISIVSYEKERKERVNAEYMSIDGTSISVLEYTYQYNLFLSDFLAEYGSQLSDIGLDTSLPFNEQYMSDGETSWETYFSKNTIQNILETNFLYDEALEKSFVYDNLETDVEQNMEKLKTTAEGKNLSFSKYLSSYYIQGTREAEIKLIIEKQIIAEQYGEEYKSNLDISEDTINQYYEQNKNDYDLVDFRCFKISVFDVYSDMIAEVSSSSISNNNVELKNTESTETTETAETEVVESAKEETTEATIETTKTGDSEESSDEMTVAELVETKDYLKAKENALTTAQDFYNQVYDEDTFRTLCMEYATEETLDAYTNQDASLQSGMAYADVPASLSKWLFDSAREEKSTAIIYDDDTLSYYIVYFKNRYKNETNYVSVKNIFLPFVSTNLTDFTFSDEDKETVKTQADSIIAEWETTEKKEKDFDNLISKYSLSSVISKSEYSNVEKNDLPVTISEWCYSTDRKAGDYTVTNDDSGYYITYFIGAGNAELNAAIREDIVSKKYTTYLQELLNTHEIKYTNN